MTRFSMAEAYEPNEIELGKGHVFQVRGLTKQVEAELDPELDALNERLKSTKGEEYVAAVGDYFDIVLKRTETPEGGKQSKPSTLLKKAWDTGTLDVETARFLFAVANGDVIEQGVPPT